MRNAVIFGANGQVGSYLAELMVAEDVDVIGVVRRTSTDNLGRINHLKNKIVLVEGDITDMASVSGIITKYKPTYIFNTAAQSHVHTSFEQPLFTFQVNTLGVINILESIRKYSPHSKLLQCGTSEQFGNNWEYDRFSGEEEIKIQTMWTPFCPDSPYAVSKVAAHELIRIYRNAYNLFLVGAISFNHEGPRRGDNFVTKKITNYVRKLRDNPGMTEKLKLGNIHASRDWSHAKDMAYGYWLALNAKNPDDYIFCSEETHTVKEFLTVAFGVINISDWTKYVEIDEKFLRPIDVEYLNGRCAETRKKLNWKPTYNFKQLVEEMVNGD